MPKFQFSGGGYSRQVKTQKSQSAKISLNFSFRGRGWYSGQVKTQKSQSGWWWEATQQCKKVAQARHWFIQTRWYPWGIQILVSTYIFCWGGFWASQNSKVPKCQDIPKFEFFWGGGGGILGKSKLKSPKVPRSA